MFQPFMTLQQAATALKAGQLGSVELVECMLDRIRRFDSQLHAFITVTEELAMTQARRADAERKAVETELLPLLKQGDPNVRFYAGAPLELST